MRPPDHRRRAATAAAALEHERLGAGLGGLDRGAGAGAAEADDDDVGLAVPAPHVVRVADLRREASPSASSSRLHCRSTVGSAYTSDVEKIVYVGWKPSGVALADFRAGAARDRSRTRSCGRRARPDGAARRRRTRCRACGSRSAIRRRSSAIWVDSAVQRAPLETILGRRAPAASPAGSRSSRCRSPNTPARRAARRAHPGPLHRRVPREARDASTTRPGSSAGRASTRRPRSRPSGRSSTSRTCSCAAHAGRAAVDGDRRGGVPRRGGDRSDALLRRDDAGGARRRNSAA